MILPEGKGQHVGGGVGGPGKIQAKNDSVGVTSIGTKNPTHVQYRLWRQ